MWEITKIIGQIKLGLCVHKNMQKYVSAMLTVPT